MTAAARRQQILDLLFEQVVLYGIQMYAWAVLTNHYHLLTRVPVFDALKVVFQRVHGRTAFEWNREENVIGRKVWYRYSDRAIRSERHYNRISQEAVNLVAGSGKLVMFGTENWCGSDGLVSFSALDGEIITESVSGLALPTYNDIRHVAYNSSYIYLGYDGRRPNPSGVAAYEIQTNTIAWIQPIPGGPIGSLVTDETVIGVGTILLNAYNGEIVGNRNQDGVEAPVNSVGNLAFWYAAVNSQASLSALEFWDDITPEINQPPLLLDNSIVLRTGHGTTLGRVRVFDRQTNGLLWETDQNVISNVAVANNRAYFLTGLAELVAMDVWTGSVVGRVTFAPVNIVADEYGFYVAASENNVFVYFGDSQQLFAFRFSADE